MSYGMAPANIVFLDHGDADMETDTARMPSAPTDQISMIRQQLRSGRRGQLPDIEGAVDMLLGAMQKQKSMKLVMDELKSRVSSLEDELDAVADAKDEMEACLQEDLLDVKTENSRLSQRVAELEASLADARPSAAQLAAQSLQELQALMEQHAAQGAVISGVMRSKTEALLKRPGAEVGQRVVCFVCQNIHAKPNMLPMCCGNLLCEGCLSGWGAHKPCAFCRASSGYMRLPDSVFNN